MAGGNLFDAGQRSEFWKKLVVKGDLAWNGIAFVGERDIEEQGMFRIETRIKVKDVDHALDEQSGADEQSESQGGLRHDESVMKAIATAAGGRVGCEFAEGVGWVRARHSPRREQAEEERGRRRERHCEGQNASVDGNVVQPGQIAGNKTKCDAQ